MFFITRTFLCTFLVLRTQVQAIHHRIHLSQLEGLHTSSPMDAFFSENHPACAAPAQIITDPSKCDEAGEALGFNIGYMGKTDYGGDCAKWAVLGMEGWYYHHASHKTNAVPICKLPAYALGGVACPTGYSVISSAAECDAAGIALSHSLTHDPAHGVQCSVSNQFGTLSVCKLPTYIASTSSSCPNGYALISSSLECEAAANEIGLTYSGGDCPVCGTVSLRAVPTPPPTAGSIWQENCHEFADGFSTNDWSAICQSLPTAPVPEYIKLEIGVVTDYFRPVTGASYCDMLTSANHHEWSNDFTTWRTPEYYFGHVGGSAADWPKNNVQGDQRKFLTFWGNGFGGSGGCCHMTYSDIPMPGRPFTMYWCAAPTLLPPQIGISSTATSPAPAPASSPLHDLTASPMGAVAAVGDPHLTNIHGQRFDLLKPGRHVMISIPRGVSAENTLLHVEAEAHRLGGSCEDMYFQELAVTGSWAEQTKAGGLLYQAQNVNNMTQEWLWFGKVELKVVHGRTQEGVRYLNLFVEHLSQTGLAVGGLLGEDDHTEAATPPEKCVQSISLMAGLAGTSGQSPSAPSAPRVPMIAAASLE